MGTEEYSHLKAQGVTIWDPSVRIPPVLATVLGGGDHYYHHTQDETKFL